MSLAFWYYLIAISESLRDMFTTASRLSLAAIILCAFLLGLKIAFSLDNDLSAYLADKASPLSLVFSLRTSPLSTTTTSPNAASAAQ